MANVIGLAPIMGGGDQNGFAGRKASTSHHGSWERQRVFELMELGHMLPWGALGLRKKEDPLALKVGGQIGPLFQLEFHGSGNAIQFPDVSSQIPAPSKSLLCELN